MAEYYVRASGGSDSNDGLSFANGWTTIQHANDNVIRDDIVYICSDGIHYPTTAINFNYTGSTSSRIVRYRGVGPAGVDDGSKATISGASLPASTNLCYITVNTNLSFENLRITAATDNNISIVAGSSTATIDIHNCRIDNATGSGIEGSNLNLGHMVTIENTEIDNNGQYGVEGPIGTAGFPCTLYNCSVHDNGSGGILIADQNGRIKIVNNIIYGNGGAGLWCHNAPRGWTIINNVFFNNNNSAIYIDDTDVSSFTLINNIFRSNTGYGIYSLQSNVNQFSFCDYNCSSGNTSGHTNINSGVLPGGNNIIADPLFVSETLGLEDFSLQSSSPCFDIGYGYKG